MKVFAISDLHLGADVDKPMDVFGPEWENHSARVAAAWRETVGPDDLVLMPGDISWAMRAEEALKDLKLLESLPGKKYFIRGNHDFWVSRPSKVRSILGPEIRLIRYDASVWRGVGICGVRGWPWPGYPEYDEEKDFKYFQRELNRLSLSLEALKGLNWNICCAMIHYPPVSGRQKSEFCCLFRDAGIKWVVYGHLHGPAKTAPVEGLIEGVNYACVSCDYIGFRPKLLFETANLSS